MQIEAGDEKEQINKGEKNPGGDGDENSDSEAKEEEGQDEASPLLE